MAKKRLEEQLEEFKNMTEEDLNKKLESNKKEIDNRLKGIYNISGKLENQPEGEKDSKLEAKREQYSKETKKLDKDTRKIEGYLKNKDKIEKIRKIQEKYNKKGMEIAKEKNLLNSKIKLLEEKVNSVQKKLEENSSEVTNPEYNEMMLNKQEIEQLKQKIEQYNKQLANYKSAVSKCDLTWKALLYNESWEDIHKKAVERNKENIKLTGPKKQLDQYREANQKENQINFRIEENEFNNTIEENEKPDFATRHPRLARIGNFFKKVRDKILGKEEIKELEAPKTEEVQKDAFIEKLRQMTELTPGEREQLRQDEYERKKAQERQQNQEQEQER